MTSTNTITNKIAGMAIALLCIFLAGIIGVFTMTSLTSLTIHDSTQVEQMRTGSIVHDTALSASAADTTATM